MVRIHQLDNILAVMYCPLDTRSAEFSTALTNLDIVWSSLPNPISIDTILGDLNLPQSAVKWVRDDFALKLMGLRYGKLDFNKAPWTEIQAELVELFKVSPTAALVGFHEKVLGILERLVSKKKKQSGNSHLRMSCQKRLL